MSGSIRPKNGDSFKRHLLRLHLVSLPPIHLEMTESSPSTELVAIFNQIKSSPWTKSSRWWWRRFVSVDGGSIGLHEREREELGFKIFLDMYGQLPSGTGQVKCIGSLDGRMWLLGSTTWEHWAGSSGLLNNFPPSHYPSPMESELTYLNSKSIMASSNPIPNPVPINEDRLLLGTI